MCWFTARTIPVLMTASISPQSMEAALFSAATVCANFMFVVVL